MKRTYNSPIAKVLGIDTEGLIADSPKGGLENGSKVNAAVPTGDGANNFFSNNRDGGSLWDE